MKIKCEVVILKTGDFSPSRLEPSSPWNQLVQIKWLEF